MIPNFKKNIFICVILFFSFSVFADTSNIETIVFVRHGEKTPVEMGQLNCQGLNRSLLLPAYFQTHFAKPDYIFAPNPSVQLDGFSYVRALATIEPTAVNLGMPVNTQIGFDQPQLLMQTLIAPQYQSATIYVAWEHQNIVKIATLLLKKFNNNSTAPNWSDKDFDKVFVFEINWNHQPATVDFTTTSENLKHINTTCPN